MRYGFNTLVKHLNEIDLLPLLDSEGGPFTMFAPTDEAFKTLNPEIFRVVDAADNGWGILQHDVVRDFIPESSITNGMVISNILDPDYRIKITFNNDQV